MKGRLWLILGVVAGVAVAWGGLPYLAGAGHTLVQTSERLIQSGANRLISGAAHRGAPLRLVSGIEAVLAILIPGIAALLMIIAAKTTLRLRAIMALVISALGALSFVYHPHGKAIGVLILALALGGLAVTLTGPLVATPLAFGAGLIGGTFLPGLLRDHDTVTQNSVRDLHLALFNSVGNPAWLQVILLLVAAVPFVFALRLVIRG